METCGGRERLSLTVRNRKRSRLLIPTGRRVLPCSVLPFFSLFQSPAEEEANKDKRLEDPPPTETVAAGEMQDEESWHCSRCWPWDKFAVPHLDVSGSRQLHSCRQGLIPGSGPCCTFRHLWASPGAWLSWSTKTEQVAGGGSPGSTDILELKDVAYEQPAYHGTWDSSKETWGLSLSWYYTLCTAVLSAEFKFNHQSSFMTQGHKTWKISFWENGTMWLMWWAHGKEGNQLFSSFSTFKCYIFTTRLCLLRMRTVFLLIYFEELNSLDQFLVEMYWLLGWSVCWD